MKMTAAICKIVVVTDASGKRLICKPFILWWYNLWWWVTFLSGSLVPSLGYKEGGEPVAVGMLHSGENVRNWKLRRFRDGPHGNVLGYLDRRY